jgi:hypothetical protein
MKSSSVHHSDYGPLTSKTGRGILPPPRTRMKVSSLIRLGVVFYTEHIASLVSQPTPHVPIKRERRS